MINDAFGEVVGGSSINPQYKINYSCNKRSNYINGIITIVRNTCIIKPSTSEWTIDCPTYFHLIASCETRSSKVTQLLLLLTYYAWWSHYNLAIFVVITHTDCILLYRKCVFYNACIIFRVRQKTEPYILRQSTQFCYNFFQNKISIFPHTLQQSAHFVIQLVRVPRKTTKIKLNVNII